MSLWTMRVARVIMSHNRWERYDIIIIVVCYLKIRSRVNHMKIHGNEQTYNYIIGITDGDDSLEL